MSVDPDDASSRLNLLLVAHFDPEGLQTVRSNVENIASHSRHRIEVLNLWHHGPSPLKIPPSHPLEAWDGIIIHPAVCYFPHNLIGIDDRLQTSLAEYRGLKVLMKQDEHHHTHAFSSFIADNQFDILVSCVPDEELPRAYRPRDLDGVRTVRQLTAYVSEDMHAWSRPHYRDRRIDISYRGSIQPLICGRLGYEKWQIGEAVRGPASEAGLVSDISSRWEDRINGAAWPKFLADSKAVLGVESGSNLFDHDGTVARLCAEFETSHPEIPPTDPAFYRLASEAFLAKFEGNVNYAQISPRHLEAAAAGCLQVLYEGDYSGLLEPHLHYFPLKRDLSNFDQLVELLRDEDRWTEITDRARQHLIGSSELTYQAFADRLDLAIDDWASQMGESRHRADPSLIGQGSRQGEEKRAPPPCKDGRRFEASKSPCNRHQSGSAMAVWKQDIDQASPGRTLLPDRGQWSAEMAFGTKNSNDITERDDDQLFDHISALNTKLKVSVEKTIEPLANQIIAYKDVVAPLSQDLKKGLSALNSSLTAVQSLEAATQKGSDAHAAAIDGAVATLRADLDKRLTEIAAQLASVEPILTGLSEANQRQPPVSLAPDELAAITGAIDVAKQELRSDLSSLETCLSAIQALDATTQQAAASNAASVESAASTLRAGLDEQLTAIAGTLERLNEASQQQDHVALVPDELAAITGAIDAAKQELRSDLSGLEACLSAIQALDATTQQAAASNAASVEAAVSTLRAGLDDQLSAIAGTLTAFGDRETDTPAGFSAEDLSTIIAAVEAAKYELQTDLSGSYTFIDTKVSGVAQQLSELETRILERLDALEQSSRNGFENPTAQVPTVVEAENSLDELKALPDLLHNRLDELSGRISNVDWALQAIGKNLVSLSHDVGSLRDEVAESSDARRIKIVLREVSDQLDTLTQHSKSERGSLEELATDFAARADTIVARIENMHQTSNEIGSQIGAMITQESGILQTALAASAGSTVVASPGLPALEIEFARSLETAALQRLGWMQSRTEDRPKVRDDYDESQFLAKLEALDPVTFPHWKQVFEAGAEPYISAPDDNCANWSKPLSRAFRDYLSLFANGPILDVGCGPNAAPCYLDGYPRDQLTGLEPLPLNREPDFKVVRGVAEDLPWPDKSFGTVVNATAIDHVMCLETALGETRRVLRPDGVFVIWYAHVQDMEDYVRKPAKQRTPVDSYHLFHANDDWFLPLMQEHFDLLDLRRVKASETIDNVFAAFRPRPMATKRAVVKRAPRSKSRKAATQAKNPQTKTRRKTKTAG